MPEYEFPPPQHSCRPTLKNFTNRALTTYTRKNVSITPHLNLKIGSLLIALSSFQTLPVYNYFHRTLSAQEKLDHLVSLLTLADDLPPSSHGWIHLSALKRYDGPAVPGNQDLHTNTILHNRTFSLSRSGSAISLDAAALYTMVAFDHRRRKHRLSLGEYQGPTKSQLVLALSSTLPRQLLDCSSIPSQRRSAPSSPTPLTLSNITAFRVYFCRKSTLTALRRDGIHSTSQSYRPGNALNISFNLQAFLQAAMSDTTCYSLSINSAMVLTCLSIFQPLSTLYAQLPKRYSWYAQGPSLRLLFPLCTRHWIRAGSPSLDSFPATNQPYTHLATASPWEHQLQKLQKHISTTPTPPRESDSDTEILSQSARASFFGFSYADIIQHRLI